MTLLQLSRDGLRAITGGKAKEPVETAGQEPAETAEIHRIYPGSRLLQIRGWSSY